MEGCIGFFFYIFSTKMFCFIAEVREFRVCHKQSKLSRFKNKLLKNPHAVVGLHATLGVLVGDNISALAANVPYFSDVLACAAFQAAAEYAAFAGVFLAFFVIFLVLASL